MMQTPAEAFIAYPSIVASPFQLVNKGRFASR